ncbi:hypothetical protein LWI29_012872 [Acer saccharum]|uniref:Uncharacterized protein n=1 Tax=Acer saccharum TaxID=4024 RepID=A0AA39W6Z6_ACESA|nr:hypothetical protein LWI29_012872 [Acer saccharum]
MNGWYEMGERIWTPLFIKFIHSHGYFNIYTNFPNERALSVSHRDAGVNYGKTAGQLLDENSIDYNFLKMQPSSNLKSYDFCFREVFPGRVVRKTDELGYVLPSLQKQETILPVSLFGVATVVGKVTLPGDRINFVYTLANILEQKAVVRIKRVDETSFGVEIRTEKNANISSLGVGKKLVYWSAELGLDVIQKQLEELRMWIIDGVAVVCHQP